MSKERKSLAEAIEWMHELRYVWSNSRDSGDYDLLDLMAGINKIELLLAQPEPEQEVYSKGYAEAMQQQVYEAFEAGRKSALSNDWNKERDAMSEAWYLPESKQELLAQPETKQEPVAWFYDYDGTTWVKLKEPDLPNMHHLVTNVRPLYLAPPTREPLSYDKIVALIQSNIANGLYSLARAIEKAHGIGVDDV